MKHWFPIALVLLGGCQSAVEGTLDLEGAVGGCFSFLDEQTCVTKDPGRVVVFVEDQSAGLRLRGWDTTPERVEGGTRWIVQVDEATTLVVEDALGRARFSVDVRPDAEAWRTALYAGASCGPEPDDTDEHIRAFYASGRARCTSEPEPMTWLLKAIDGHRARGDGQRLDWDLAMWAELASYSEPVPGGIWLPSQRSLESTYFWHYHHGRKANASGNLADAHWFLEEARRTAVVLKREDQGSFYMGAVTTTAENLAAAGRYLEAASVSVDALPALSENGWESGTCQTLCALSTAAWFSTLADRPASETEGLLTEAEESLRAQPELCPPSLGLAWHTKVNRAAFLARSGDLANASKALSEVDLDDAPNELGRAWASIFIAEESLAEGRPQEVEPTVRSYLDEQGRSPFQPQAALVAARASLALEDTPRARTHLEASLSAVEDIARRAPLGHSRGSVLDSMAYASWLLANIQYEEGSPSTAFATLRRHRRRNLIGLHQAVAAANVGAYRGVRWQDLRQTVDSGSFDVEDWEQETGQAPRASDPGDTGTLPPEVTREIERILQSPTFGPAAPLRQPREHELMVLAAVFDGFLDIWVHEAGAEPRRSRLTDPGTPGRRVALVAQAIGPKLEGIDQVTYLPIGDLRSAPLSSAVWNGHPLGLQVTVATTLDLGSTPALGDLTTSAVVADPTGDLASARIEGETVASILDGPLDVQLRTGTAASEQEMLALLTSSLDVVHFAGHASFAEDGWSSGLALAEGKHLPAWKLLSLDRVPPVVSMTACESSKSGTGASERLGLAQAFVLAGSQYVVAADVPVEDSLARTFGEAWAGAIAAGASPPRAWLAATQQTAKVHPGQPWWSFRLWTP